MLETGIRRSSGQSLHIQWGGGLGGGVCSQSGGTCLERKLSKVMGSLLRIVGLSSITLGRESMVCTVLSWVWHDGERRSKTMRGFVRCEGWPSLM